MGFTLRIWGGRRFGWLEAGFLAVVIIALVMRLWELGGRTAHYDEAIHLHFSWKLAESGGAFLGWPWIFGTDYLHSPWMHGPFQIEFTALIFRIFGDTDVTARLGYVLFGTGLVAVPFFFRHYLGRTGALMAAVMLTFSPTMLYFSRFGRNDIIMAFFASTLLILMWRYINEGHRRYLYLASGILALMFATKETAYLVVAVLGAISLALVAVNGGRPQLRQISLSRAGRPARDDGPGVPPDRRHHRRADGLQSRRAVLDAARAPGQPAPGQGGRWGRVHRPLLAQRHRRIAGRLLGLSLHRQLGAARGREDRRQGLPAPPPPSDPVSYTHLTLPPRDLV